MLNAEMNYHSDSSPMLSPPRRHKNSNKSRSTGKSKTNVGSRQVIAGNNYGNQTPSPITKPLNRMVLNISNPVGDNDDSGDSNNINRNLLNAFEMSPIHEARSKKEGKSSFQTKKNHKFKEIEHALSSMLLSPVEESAVDLTLALKKKSIIWTMFVKAR